ncbi:MAG: glucokinase [Saprospiraceae bacterium]|jgi:glucokinase
MVLGIDIGGTTIKCALVSPSGEITEKEVIDTKDAVDQGLFVEKLGEIINNYKIKFPQLEGVGLGFPGLISKDRESIVDLANIPSVKSQNIVKRIGSMVPGLKVKIENDAKCATMAEKIFGDPSLDNYMFITLGTGVGSGLVLDNKMFLGAKGNATEIGHMFTTTGKVLEHEVGLRQLGEYAVGCLAKPEFSDSILQGSATLNPKELFDSAKKGDALSLHVFDRAGTLIGETLVNIMRVLDIDTFLLGGGVAGALEFLEPAARKKIVKELGTGYYTDNLSIRRAKLENEAGILGAASLVYHN